MKHLYRQTRRERATRIFNRDYQRVITNSNLILSQNTVGKRHKKALEECSALNIVLLCTCMHGSGMTSRTFWPQINRNYFSACCHLYGMHDYHLLYRAVGSLGIPYGFTLHRGLSISHNKHTIRNRIHWAANWPLFTYLSRSSQRLEIVGRAKLCTWLLQNFPWYHSVMYNIFRWQSDLYILLYTILVIANVCQ